MGMKEASKKEKEGESYNRHVLVMDAGGILGDKATFLSQDAILSLLCFAHNTPTSACVENDGN
jgi:hypothetical protein